MNGTLYGVGVGPGDPELITLKAIRIINQCQLIAVPTNDKTTCLAYKIASGAVDLTTKPCIEIPMPMTKNAAELEQYHTNGANTIAEYLKQGQDIAFLTLGDPTIYATYIYLHKKVEAMDYETQIISGIPLLLRRSRKTQYSVIRAIASTAHHTGSLSARGGIKPLRNKSIPKNRKPNELAKKTP